MANNLRLLLWLKLMLSWRGYRANKLKILSLVAFGIILVPVLMLATGIHWLIGHTAAPLHGAIARDALAAVYLIWIIAPLIGFQLNESYDLTKLFTYPIGYGQIFLGGVLGSMVDPPVLLVLPPMVALWLGFSAGAGAAAATFILLSLFLLQTLAMTQAITTVMIGFLRSRRFRDVTIVVLPFIGLTYYVGQQTIARQLVSMNPLAVLNAPVWRMADYLPPGFAAAGMAAIAQGAWPQALGWAAVLCVCTALTMTVAAQALKRLYLGDSGVAAFGAGGAPRSAIATQQNRPVWTPAWLPDEIAGISAKEFKYLQRDPQCKAQFVQMLYIVVAIAAPFIMPHVRSGYSGEPVSTWWSVFPLFGVAAALNFSSTNLLFNIFGAEGAAITVLFSFPVRRRNILLAKNLAHAVTLLTLNLVGLCAIAEITHNWAELPVVYAGLTIVLPIMLAVGNLISIRLPHRMLVRGQRWQRGGVAAAGSSGTGCAFAFLYLIAYTGTVIVAAPVAAAVIFPMFTSSPGIWYAVALPLAACYSITLYVLLLRTAEGWLLSREPEIATAVSPPD